MKQAGSSSPVELGFGARIICLQVVALKSHGLREATGRLCTSLTSVAGVGGFCGLRSIQTLVTVKQGTEESGWRVRHQPPHPHQLTQFPRTVRLQPSTGTGGNPPLLSAALPAATCKNGTVLQPPQQTSVLFRLKAKGSAIARDPSPFQECRGMEDGNRVGEQDMGAVPCKTSALPGLLQLTFSSSRVCLPAASSREPFQTPHHQARHPAFWTSSPVKASFCLGDPAGAGSLPFCQPLCVSQR